MLDTHPVIFFFGSEKYAQKNAPGGSSGTRLALGCRADPHLRCLDYVPSVAAGWVRGTGVASQYRTPLCNATNEGRGGF